MFCCQNSPKIVPTWKTSTQEIRNDKPELENQSFLKNSDAETSRVSRTRNKEEMVK